MDIFAWWACALGVDHVVDAIMSVNIAFTTSFAKLHLWFTE